MALTGALAGKALPKAWAAAFKQENAQPICLAVQAPGRSVGQAAVFDWSALSPPARLDGRS